MGRYLAQFRRLNTPGARRFETHPLWKRPDAVIYSVTELTAAVVVLVKG